MHSKKQITIMGIVNATPDSFSDGVEENLNPEILTQKALDMIAAGADIIDIGGESTRPGSEYISLDEEMDRVIPVVEALRKRSEVKISVDTNKSQVAEKALAVGADIINDVTAFSNDDKMATVVAESRAEVVLMHMQGTPKNMQLQPVYSNVVDEVLGYLQERILYAANCGIARDRIIIDPGFGFGKSFEDNCRLLQAIDRFAGLDCRVLVGVSRKSMIGEVLDVAVDQRLEGSMALAVYAQLKGAHILRVHDVLATRRAVDMITAVESVVD